MPSLKPVDQRLVLRSRVEGISDIEDWIAIAERHAHAGHLGAMDRESIDGLLEFSTELLTRLTKLKEIL